MADNINVTPTTGSGTVPVATEACTVNSVPNVQVQVVKAAFGDHGVFTEVSSTVGMPVAVVGTVPVSVAGTVAVGGTVAVSNFPSGFAVVGAVEVANDAGNPLPVAGAVTVAGVAQDGTDYTGSVQLTGGVGVRGWLSGCFKKLSDILTALGGTIVVTGTVAAVVTDSVPLAVSGAFWQATQPVSGNVGITGAVTLPTGAATAAKQPALGVAGTPSVDVISVQGETGMTPIITTQSTRLPLGAVAISASLTADIVDTTPTPLLAAPAAGKRNYITQLTVFNAHATVNTRVDIKDGANLLYSGPAAALFGGFSFTFDPPLVQPQTATAINVVCGTTGAQVRASCNGYVV